MAEREKEIQNQIDTMKEIRKRAGLNRREFSEYMGIPIRTLEAVSYTHLTLPTKA